MRVTWVVYGKLDQPTGGYVYDRSIVEGLRRAGDEVRTVALGPGGCGRELTQLEASDVLVLDALCTPDLAAGIEHLGVRPRVLLVHHLTSWERDVDDREARARAESIVHRTSDALIATSHATATRLTSQCDERPVHVVVPGGDRLPRVPRHPPGETLRLLVLGSLVPRKRVLLVLEALDACRSDRIELQLIGDATRDPEYAARVRDRIAASPRLRQRVVQRGVVADDELALQLSRTDAVVLASSLEGYGIALSEARFLGVPQLVARPAALPEVVDSGEDVVLFADAGELTRVLEGLCADTDQLRSLRTAAQANASRVPSWAAAIERFGRVLASVVRASAPGPARERAASP